MKEQNKPSDKSEEDAALVKILVSHHFSYPQYVCHSLCSKYTIFQVRLFESIKKSHEMTKCNLR